MYMWCPLVRLVIIINNTTNNNNSEVLLGAIIHRPDAPIAQGERVRT